MTSCNPDTLIAVGVLGLVALGLIVLWAWVVARAATAQAQAERRALLAELDRRARRIATLQAIVDRRQKGGSL